MYVFTVSKDGINTRMMVGCDRAADIVATSLRAKGYTVSPVEVRILPIERDFEEMMRAQMLTQVATLCSLH